jgi:hypothetical protein
VNYSEKEVDVKDWRLLLNRIIEIFYEEEKEIEVIKKPPEV